MEHNPLGRAEWLKFISYFFDKEQIADSLINQIADKYQSLKAIADTISNKPTIFSEKMYGDAWYVAGGQSYVAALFADAGLNYVWRNDKSTNSVPMDLESVLSSANHADYWCFICNTKDSYTYSDLADECGAYSQFDAFKSHNVIYCNANIKPYFEEGLFEPDVLLADLLHICHRGMLPDHKPKYYELMK